MVMRPNCSRTRARQFFAPPAPKNTATRQASLHTTERIMVMPDTFIARVTRKTTRRSLEQASKAGLLALLIAMAPLAASAAGMPEFALTIQNHRFEPATLKVPVNTKFKVRVTNKDGTASEFESNDFNREKIVLPGSTVTVFIGPLDKGTYKFFDDFHQDTEQGVLIVE